MKKAQHQVLAVCFGLIESKQFGTGGNIRITTKIAAEQMKLSPMIVKQMLKKRSTNQPTPTFQKNKFAKTGNTQNRKNERKTFANQKDKVAADIKTKWSHSALAASHTQLISVDGKQLFCDAAIAKTPFLIPFADLFPARYTRVSGHREVFVFGVLAELTKTTFQGSNPVVRSTDADYLSRFCVDFVLYLNRNCIRTI